MSYEKYEEESLIKLKSVNKNIEKFISKYSDLMSDFISDVLEGDNEIDFGDEILSLCIFRAGHTAYIKMLALTMDEETIHIALRDICKGLLNEVLDERTMMKHATEQYLQNKH